jgi:hypothetical protein
MGMESLKKKKKKKKGNSLPSQFIFLVLSNLSLTFCYTLPQVLHLLYSAFIIVGLLEREE